MVTVMVMVMGCPPCEVGLGEGRGEGRGGMAKVMDSTGTEGIRGAAPAW